ncbi:MAG: tryptophan synthase subunit alpha [Bacteroidota bacterium]
MNRINQLFENKKGRILSVYYSAGFPELDNTLDIAIWLEKAGADMIEIGIPFSDPIADGPTIQESNKVALDNGMTLELLFKQIKELREHVSVPVILMGYVNPVLQYGVDSFCDSCKEVGVDGLILPDLPMSEFLTEYQSKFDQHGLKNIFLITPQTSDKRIRQVDENSSSFIYMVSTSSTTGAKDSFGDEQARYFERVKALNLVNPTLVGFGISNKITFDQACVHSKGAIIGSAFIKRIGSSSHLESDTHQFVRSIKE